MQNCINDEYLLNADWLAVLEERLREGEKGFWFAPGKELARTPSEHDFPGRFAMLVWHGFERF
jgi:hypothetical protein